LPSAEVARFTLALSIASTLLLVAGAVNQVWAPRFYRLICERPFAEVERKNSNFHRLLAIALSLVAGLVLIVFPYVFDVLGGNLVAYRNMRVELALLLAAYVMLTPWWHCQYHFLSHARGRSFLNTTLTTSAVGLAVLLVLIRAVGPIGIYVGF